MRNYSKILSTVLLLSPFTFVNAVNKFSIDCSNKLRKATHCANGSLYGIIENVPPEKDYDRLVDAIHPFVMRNPARGRNGNQHAFGEAIPVAKRLSKTPGAVVSVDLADILPYWPYKWPGMNKWLDEVRSFIKDKKESGLTNWYGLEIWNEAENTWRDSNGHSFNELWKKTYDLIRELDPNEKIIGPCDGLYSERRFVPFLNFCKENNCLPDIMCWHELSGLDNISRNFRAYRELEKRLGIPELPITINEYCDPNHEYEGQPGSDARFFGKFERYKIDSGLISWWFVPKPGRLGSLLATNDQPGAGWYFHKWYGDMTGDMLYVKPPNDDSKLVDGAACFDEQQGYISFLFGGPNDGTIEVNFDKIPESFGTTIKVKAEKIDWKSKDTPSNGPNTMWEKDFNVSNGSIQITVNGCNPTTGYRLYLTGKPNPGAGAGAGAGIEVNVGAGNQTQPVQPQPQQPQQPNQPTTQPTTQTPVGTCPNTITSKGYKCCTGSCTVIYSDADGTWGVQNGEWCGCPLSEQLANCPAGVTTLGYKCCHANNWEVYATDATGKWGVENNQWCGITPDCKF